MKRMTGIVAVMFVLGVTDRIAASDLTGIYAVIDRVTPTSVGQPDETIQVRGLFSLAFGGGFNYKPPVYGYMFFRLKKGQEAVCRKEWADFKRVAGTGQCIAFASRYRPLGRVRKLSEKPVKPDVSPLNIGVRKMGTLDISKRQIRPTRFLMSQFRLAYFPRPSTPTEGAKVPVGRIPLVVDNVLANDKQARYFFEIKNETGKSEASAAIEPGKKQTRWTPKMQITPGGKYTWRAWIVTPVTSGTDRKTKPWMGPVVTVQFHGKQPK